MTRPARPVVITHERQGHLRIVHISHSLPQMQPGLAAAWATWLARHGIDPEDVVLGPPLVCDDQTRTVRYTAPDRHPNGQAVIGEHGVATHVAVVQLEAPALPMPNELESSR